MLVPYVWAQSFFFGMPTLGVYIKCERALDCMFALRSSDLLYLIGVNMITMMVSLCGIVALGAAVGVWWGMTMRGWFPLVAGPALMVILTIMAAATCLSFWTGIYGFNYYPNSADQLITVFVFWVAPWLFSGGALAMANRRLQRFEP
jgi:hypothetical protein